MATTPLIRYQLDVSGLAGGPGLMTFHCDPLLVPTPDQDLVDGIQAFLDAIDLYQSTSIAFLGFDYVEYFDPVTGQVTAQQGVSAASSQGDDATAVLPPVNQMLLRWNTGVWVAGRQLKGKTFLPGFCEDSNEPGGVPQAAIRTVIDSAANTLAANVGLVVWSRTHGLHEPVSVASCSPQWAYLSGRRD